MLRCVGSRNKIAPDKMSDMMATVLDNHHFGTEQCPCPRPLIFRLDNNPNAHYFYKAISFDNSKDTQHDLLTHNAYCDVESLTHISN